MSPEEREQSPPIGRRARAVHGEGRVKAFVEKRRGETAGVVSIYANKREEGEWRGTFRAVRRSPLKGRPEPWDIFVQSLRSIPSIIGPEVKVILRFGRGAAGNPAV
ncbi:hypothetical protein KM043_006213 [Ampulex compressa]|nr:hypothetical protein KM043_006213 [Ampulex compressa]